MSEISKITLPVLESGSLVTKIYDLKDATARAALSSIGEFIVAYRDGDEPDRTKIPEGVVVEGVTGSLTASADTTKKFYLVFTSGSTITGIPDAYDEYVTVFDGGLQKPYSWERIGSAKIDLTGLVRDVTLNTSSTEVIGKNATFTVTQPTVSLASASTETVISPSASLTASYNSGDITVKELHAAASGTAIGADGTANVYSTVTVSQQPSFKLTPTRSAVEGSFAVPASISTNVSFNSLDTKQIPTSFATQKLAVVSIPDFTNVGIETGSLITSTTNVTSNLSTWAFTVNGESLNITGGNGNTVSSSLISSTAALPVHTGSLSGNSITVATGEVTNSGSGAQVMTGWSDTASVIGANATLSGSSSISDYIYAVPQIDTPVAISGSTTSVLTGVKVTAQPTISITTESVTAQSGAPAVVTNVAAPAVSFVNNAQKTVTVLNGTSMTFNVTGGNVAFNDKDTKTVLNSASVTVDKNL